VGVRSDDKVGSQAVTAMNSFKAWAIALGHRLGLFHPVFPAFGEPREFNFGGDGYRSTSDTTVEHASLCDWDLFDANFPVFGEPRQLDARTSDTGEFVEAVCAATGPWRDDVEVNPATGLPMLSSDPSGYDVGGHFYGSSD
jgi:hypothetical protein